MKSSSSALGYHVFGDHFFYTRFSEADLFQGEAAKVSYRDPVAFLALVTSVHEHVHLVQSHVSGFCLWLETAKNQLMRETAKIVHTAGLHKAPFLREPELEVIRGTTARSARHRAARASLEHDQALQFLDFPELTNKLVTAEVADAPEMDKFLSEEAATLTTLDLLECQAALVTEWKVQGLLDHYPDRFDAEVVDELAESFRISRLPTAYGKALRVFSHMQKQMKLRLRWREGEPASIEDQQIYHVLIYLIDYALHIPPQPDRLREAFNDDTAALQDVYPPLRFILLCLVFCGELVQGRTDLGDSENFYTLADECFADLINRMHDSVRHERVLKPGDWRNSYNRSFYSIHESTSLWIEFLAMNSVPLQSLEIVKMKALVHRRNKGLQMYLGTAFDFYAESGLPIVRDTPSGLRALTYFTTEGELTMQEVMSIAEGRVRNWVRGPDWERKRADQSTASPPDDPWALLQDAANRRLDQEGARLVLKGGPIRCPLTLGCGKYMLCPLCSPRCARIEGLDDLPYQGCRLRDRIQKL